MSGKSRILIIDDDENIRKVVAAILRDTGYVVDLAETGAQAIAKTGQTAYNLLLIDIRLPDMEGTELLTKVHETVPKIRKIIVTGYPTLQNAVSSINNGADGYLVKPFDVDKMLEIIQKQLELQAQEACFSEERVADFIQTRVRELACQRPKRASR